MPDRLSDGVQSKQTAPIRPELVGSSNGSAGAALKLPNSKANPGADGRTRTADLLITNQLLYQLSYVG